jgi:hypothetical protein
MRLGLVMLDPNSTLNSLKYLREVYINQGDTANIMFQLVDLDTVDQNNLIGDRYVPVAASKMQITITSMNDANTLILNVNMAFPNDDRSIWTFSLTQYQTSKAAGVNINAVLTQGTQVNNILAKNVLFIGTPSTYCC